MRYARSPQEAYRRIDLDARVSGARHGELVDICYDQLISSLGTSIYADRNGNNPLKSQSLTRALSAILALQMGINMDMPIAQSLFQFYGSARQSILESAIEFDADVIALIQKDFKDIQAKLRSSS